MHRLLFFWGFFLVFSFMVLKDSRAEKYEKTAFAGQKIVIAGTGDSQEILRAMAEALAKKIEGGQIDVPESIGSGGGIKALLAGECDLARVARPLNEREKGIGLSYLIFARSPVVFTVHPGVTGIDNLNTADIIGIYSGKITKWEQLGAASGKIYPIIRESGDSSRETLNTYLPGFRGIAEYRAQVAYTTQNTVDLLKKYKNTIGFLPITAVRDTDLRVMKIDNISPTAENINNGLYIYITSFAVVYQKEPAGLTKAFIDFLSSGEGKRIIAEFGAIPSR